mmetsp:Transcript_7977/g.17316  ORF Transcript_7977/g.17316 Transcript_7977/m.17316 type:complete len:370 (-) Transcript_7977:370-1479(-)|eukprot:CAMPEP_0113308588 /NCGR_PEP_ID=MMETSP0010_2-20120614/6976_1 /TAXON_ID=216773 ORGANISM="Corethron hystrix, Strain 308" /NCGR_SAMPLE_ID=MMETSP0010_2 /ASSEMBLY_ACC=CAM_ASM_000155 /LENGTH=369 /DNA_ID=CAMNT_0000163679 /DNA_START=180 /DNA_END=1289 /DNA_ORIENTATION=+ /assembly_acc=CAM_ASM_000155
MSVTASSAANPVSPDYIIERVRVVIKDAHVFKLPPRVSAKGWRGADWVDKVWQGTLKVMERGDVTLILLVDERQGGKVFATCPVKEGSIDRCIDSSRYFVLRVENTTGRHMFVGVAFNERCDAFDFNTALEDSRKEKEYDRKPIPVFDGPKKDYSLKEGQKIHVKIPMKNRRRRKNSRRDLHASNSKDSKDSAEGRQTPPVPEQSSEENTNQLKAVSSESLEAEHQINTISTEEREQTSEKHQEFKMPLSYSESDDTSNEQYAAEIIQDSEKESWKSWLFKTNRRLTRTKSTSLLPSSKDTPKLSNRLRRTSSKNSRSRSLIHRANHADPGDSSHSLPPDRAPSKGSPSVPWKQWGDWGSPAASTAAYS